MRPASRSGGAAPPPGALRPPSARPGTGRPPTGMRPQSGRLGTARVGTPGGSRLPQHVGQRTVVNQGVTGTKPATPGGGPRQVADRSYFLTELRTRIVEIDREMEKMNQAIDQAEKDNQQSIQLQRVMQELEADVNDKKGKLRDFNFLLDKINTSVSVNELNDEEIWTQVKAVQQKNFQDNAKGDSVYTENTQKMAQIQSVEEQITKIEEETEKKVLSLDPEQREIYSKLRESNLQLQATITKEQNAIDDITIEMKQIEEELKNDSGKQKLLAMLDEIDALEKQKRDLEDETGASNLSIPEEIERLTHKVKESNAEITKIEQHTNATIDAINKFREGISQTEKLMQESKGDRAEKFRELVNKDKDMTTFIEKYEKVRQDNIQNNTKLELTVMNLLEKISRVIERCTNLPSSEQFAKMQNDLMYKADQMSRSQSTASKLQEELHYRKLELQKMQNLDQKILEETRELQDKMKIMREELMEFEKVDSLKAEAETFRSGLQQEKQEFAKKKELLGQENAITQETLDALEKQVAENETHSQLVVLEKSLRHYEQNNFQMAEYIATKGKEADYQLLLNENLRLVHDLNKYCIQAYM